MIQPAKKTAQGGAMFCGSRGQPLWRTFVPIFGATFGAKEGQWNRQLASAPRCPTSSHIARVLSSHPGPSPLSLGTGSLFVSLCECS